MAHAVRTLFLPPHPPTTCGPDPLILVRKTRACVLQRKIEVKTHNPVVPKLHQVK